MRLLEESFVERFQKRGIRAVAATRSCPAMRLLTGRRSWRS